MRGRAAWPVLAALLVAPTAVESQAPLPEPAPRAAGQVDSLLERWSARALSAYGDSLQGLVTGEALDAWIDSLLAASPDTTAPASAASAEGRPARLELEVGVEVEGLDQAFGSASLAPLSDTETPATATDSSAALSVRYVERETAPLALIGLRANAGSDAWMEVQSRWGDERADATLEAYARARSGPLRGLALRELFYWDRDQSGAASRQNLLTLRWAPPAGGSWRVGLRGTLDVSRSEEATVEVDPSGGTTAADSSAWLTFLNYERASVRVELTRLGRSSSAVSAELTRKRIAGPGTGSYTEARAGGQQFWVLGSSLLDLDLQGRRREVDDTDATLGSFWDAEARIRWLGSGPRWWLDAGLDATGTLYDGTSAELLALAEDQLVLDAEALVHRRLVGDEPAGGDWSWDAGAGPVAELIRLRSGSGDATALGGRISSRLSAPGSRGGWMDGSLEAGRRGYRDAQAQRWTYEGLSLSVSQTDYTYARVSWIGGGPLPGGFAWQGYLSFDQEWHDAAADDARLLSFSLALTRRISLF